MLYIHAEKAQSMTLWIFLIEALFCSDSYAIISRSVKKHVFPIAALCCVLS